jgi:hypothetical protein
MLVWIGLSYRPGDESTGPTPKRRRAADAFPFEHEDEDEKILADLIDVQPQLRKERKRVKQ